MSFHIGYNLFNGIEAFLWLAISLVLFLRIAYIPIPFKNNTKWGGVFFALFGLSDIAEIIIGGIFEPHQYWLLTIKVVCVIALVSLLIRYFRIKNRFEKAK